MATSSTSAAAPPTAPGGGPRQAVSRFSARTPLRVKLITALLALVIAALACISVAGIFVFRGYLLNKTDHELNIVASFADYARPAANGVVADQSYGQPLGPDVRHFPAGERLAPAVRTGYRAAEHPVQRGLAQGQRGTAGDRACAGRRQRLAGLTLPAQYPSARHLGAVDPRHPVRRHGPRQHQPDHRAADQHRPDRRRGRRARPGHHRRGRGPDQHATAGRDRADGRRDRRRGSQPARTRPRSAHRGRQPRPVAQHHARPHRGRVQRPGRVRGDRPPVREPDAAVRGRCQPRAAHAADRHQGLCRVLPPARRRGRERQRRTAQPRGPGPDHAPGRDRGHQDGTAGRGSAAAGPDRPAAPARAAPGGHAGARRRRRARRQRDRAGPRGEAHRRPRHRLPGHRRRGAAAPGRRQPHEQRADPHPGRNADPGARPLRGARPGSPGPRGRPRGRRSRAGNVPGPGAAGIRAVLPRRPGKGAADRRHRTRAGHRVRAGQRPRRHGGRGHRAGPGRHVPDRPSARPGGPGHPGSRRGDLRRRRPAGQARPAGPASSPASSSGDELRSPQARRAARAALRVWAAYPAPNRQTWTSSGCSWCSGTRDRQPSASGDASA